jgi:flagellar biosynthetic protein FlhB
MMDEFLFLDPFWISLQWFAAEDEGRTEQPTEQKIQKAREEGKVAKSPDLTAAVVLLLPIGLVFLASGYFFTTLHEMLVFYLTRVTDNALQNKLFDPGPFFDYLLRLSLPILAVALVAGVVGNVVQVGFLFTTKPITPDFSRIVPKFGQFFQRSLFSAEALFNLGKSILKIIVVAIIALINIQSAWPRFVHLMDTPFAQGAGFIGSLSLMIVLQGAVALLLLSIPDYMFQRWRHTESLMMSREEVKEERKQSEGDPLVKSRLREKMRQILRQNLSTTVPKATVVVTNPTHFACALEWNSLTMNAPTLTAKGEDVLAQKIKEIARESGVPIVENKPLARSLYYSVNIGDEIPQEYWEVVVRILVTIQKADVKREAVG